MISVKPDNRKTKLSLGEKYLGTREIQVTSWMSVLMYSVIIFKWMNTGLIIIVVAFTNENESHSNRMHIEQTKHKCVFLSYLNACRLSGLVVEFLPGDRGSRDRTFLMAECFQ